MFARRPPPTAGEDDSDGDSPMGLGLPFRPHRSGAGGKEANYPAAAAADSDDEDMKPATAAVGGGGFDFRTLAITRAMQRVEDVSSQKMLQRQRPETKSNDDDGDEELAPAPAAPEFKAQISSVPVPEGVRVVDAVVFVMDMTSSDEKLTGGVPHKAAQAQTVDKLLSLGKQPLTACVMGLGSHKLDVVNFNLNKDMLVCPSCKETKPLVFHTRARNGVKGEGVHRTRTRACADCKTPVDRWLLAEKTADPFTDAKVQADAIRSRMSICVNAATDRSVTARHDLVWKAALGCLQELPMQLRCGPGEKDIVLIRKSVVLFSQHGFESRLPMPMAHGADGMVEWVPVFQVLATTSRALLDKPCVVGGTVDGLASGAAKLLDQRREQHTRCVQVLATGKEALLSVPDYTLHSMLLLPWFGAVGFVSDPGQVKAELWERGGASMLQDEFELDPDFLEDDDSGGQRIDYQNASTLVKSAAIAMGAADDYDGKGRSAEVHREGEKRGGKRRRTKL
jgi:hypothetical protein